MKPIVLISLAILFVAGCAFIDRAREDYKLGNETPYADGEKTSVEKSRDLAAPISTIPWANLSTPVILLLGPYIFTWLRGRRIRLENLAENPNPITGKLGKNIGAEALIQHIANVAAGLFEVGPNGSVIKRGWKAMIVTGIGVLLAPETAQIIHDILIPYFQNTPPHWLAGLFNGTVLALTIGGLAAAEKWLSKVQPLVQPSKGTTDPVLED